MTPWASPSLQNTTKHLPDASESFPEPPMKNWKFSFFHQKCHHFRDLVDAFKRVEWIDLGFRGARSTESIIEMSKKIIRVEIFVDFYHDLSFSPPKLFKTSEFGEHSTSPPAPPYYSFKLASKSSTSHTNNIQVFWGRGRHAPAWKNWEWLVEQMSARKSNSQHAPDLCILC